MLILFAFGQRYFIEGVATAGLGSLRRLGELTAGDVSFEDLERIIGSDIGLSLKLLRYVNSAFFALPRTVGSVREALTLLGVRTVRRWATVMIISAIPDVPDELVSLALRRARMCEMLAGSALPEERETLFTIGLFSVADALLDAPMSEVLSSLKDGFLHGELDSDFWGNLVSVGGDVLGTIPGVANRLKMAKTTKLVAIVEADGKLYSATKEVKVTVGGCGG